MNPTDIYLRAIKRTFADLYGVSPDTVDVSWTSDGEIGEDPPSNVAVGSSMSFQAQAAYFRFSPDSGRIDAWYRSATKSADARRGAAVGGELHQTAGAAA